MKVVLKLLVALGLIIFIGYQVTFYMMPSVLVSNSSGHLVNEFTVKLPNSNLNFGSLEASQENEIYYSSDQKGGSVEYRVVFHDKATLAGTCDYVTNNEIPKRFEITILRNDVKCSDAVL